MRTSLAFALALLLAATPAAAQEPDADTPARVPTIVKIHADWCGKCAAIEPAWERVEEELGDDARIVVFDVTNRETTRAAAAHARALGLEAFFETHKSKTGLVGVLPPGETEASEVLVAETEFEPYREAVAAVTPAE